MTTNIPPMNNASLSPTKSILTQRAKLITHSKIFLRLLFYAAGIFFTLALRASAVTIRSVGAYDIYFYNSGESDESGTGSQVWTSQQIEDIIASITVWSSRITNTTGRQVVIHLFWNNLGSSILGSTSNLTTSEGGTTYSNTELVWREGENLSSSSSYDARISLSTGVTWNTGTETPASSEIDLRSVITHELGHTLGFFSTYNYGTDRFSSSGLSTWDKLLVDGSGNKPLAGGTGTPGNFNQLDNPVYFTGSNAVAYYGGNVPVYAPSTYESGSSLSHLDETLLPDALMSPQIGAGESIRSATDLEWAIMKDLGWSVTDINTWSKGGGTLNWGTATNWYGGSLPDSTWNVNFTDTGLSSGDTIVLGANRTFNALSIDCSTSFAIGGSTGTLTLNSGYITRSTDSSGTQTIARPLVIGANTVWDISGDGSLTVSGSLTAADSLTKIGAGMVVLSGSANIPDTLNIDNGDLTLAGGGTLTVGSISGLMGALNFDGGALNLTGTNTLSLYGIRVGKDGVGSFTLSAGKSLIADVFLTIGRDSGGNGAFYNYGAVTCSTNLFSGANDGSYGNYVQYSGATTTVTSATYVGYESGSTGVIEINGGTLTTAYLEPGYSGTGTVTQTGGTVSASTATVIGYNSGSAGTLNINGGTLTTPYIYSGYNGAGTVTQTGGTVTLSGALNLAYAGQGTYNLNGGTLILKSLTKGSGTAEFNFGGGTLQASASFSTAVPMTLTGAGGDATINTQAYTVTLSSSVSGDGDLKKLGSGTLTLSSLVDYSGVTTISAGKLQLNGTSLDLASITGAGNLSVGNGSTASTLTADSISVSTLTISAGSKIVINPFSGGTSSLAANLTTVPEPSALILLLLAGLMGILYCKCKPHF
jgi:autotransporter-associated beta strand protein